MEAESSVRPAVWLAALGATTLLALLSKWLSQRWRHVLSKDEVVLVTGCDSGFGLAIVHALRDNTNVSIFAGYITEDGGIMLAALGPRVIAVPMDVTKDDEVAAAFASVEASGKPLRGVVSNAGIGCYGWCEQLAMERFERNVHVNLLGTIRVTKSALPLLRECKGRLVTIGSLGGRIPAAFSSAYIPTKAAVASFQDCVRQEVHRFGVRCSLVEPGFFATGMFQRSAAIGAQSSATEGSASKCYDPYAVKLKRTEKNVLICEWLNGEQAGVRRVTDVVLDALTAGSPRAQYLVGCDAHILGFVGPFIPSWILDLVQTYLI